MDEHSKSQDRAKELVELVESIKTNMQKLFRISAETILSNDENYEPLKPILINTVDYSLKAFNNWLKVSSHFNIIKLNMDFIHVCTDEEDEEQKNYPIFCMNSSKNDIWICTDQENPDFTYGITDHIFSCKEKLLDHLPRCVYKNRKLYSFSDLEKYWHAKHVMGSDFSFEELKELKKELHIIDK